MLAIAIALCAYAGIALLLLTVLAHRPTDPPAAVVGYRLTFRDNRPCYEAILTETRPLPMIDITVRFKDETALRGAPAQTKMPDEIIPRYAGKTGRVTSAIGVPVDGKHFPPCGWIFVQVGGDKCYVDCSNLERVEEGA